MMDIEKAGFVTDDNTGGYYVCECDNCGHVFSSENALGGNAIADTGDYDDIYCPSCHQINIGQCENPEKVWNTQQAKINGLLITLKSAEQERDQYKVDAEKYALCKSKAVNDLGHNHVYSALQELESLRAQLKAAQEPAIRIENGRVVDYNPNYEGDVSNGEFYAAPVHAKQSPAVPDENAWIIERLSYHKYEREDLSIDDCLKYLSTEWKEIQGRTTRQLIMQILELLASAPSPRITEQEFSDEEYICIRDAVDRLINAVGKDVDGDQSECSLCAEFIDELIADVINPLKIRWYETDHNCGYSHLIERITEQDSASTPDQNQCALKSITDAQVNAVARSFWRRIYPFRNDYEKELPAKLPIEFFAHMATALSWVDKQPSEQSAH